MLKVFSFLCMAGASLVAGQADTTSVVAQASAPKPASEKKISLFTAIDVGRVEAGRDLRQGNFDASGTALNRTYVNVGFNDRVDEHFLVSVGVGGIFWRAFATSSASVDDKVIKFGPGISNAYMQWLPTENMDLTFGFFSYKYNDAARNLGEYLFRSEAYPTIIYTGGWNWINDAQYSTVGAKFTHRSFDGRLRQDIGLFTEYFNSPIYDITPAYIATAKPVDWFTVGGAVALHRYITPTPATKREITKDYLYRKDFYLPASSTRPAEYVTMLEDDLRNLVGNDPSYNMTFDSIASLPQNQGNDSATVSFDLAAVKLMAFFEVNFNKLLGFEEARMGAFNVYGEIAQLGLKDYPIFYTDKAQRRPIMLGVSVPTFGLLNNLSLEGEYLKNPNIESIASTYDNLNLSPDTEFRYKTFKRDDYKWSVHASKQLSSFLTLYVQVANDHMRLKNGFTQPQYIPVTNEPSHWYWLTRIQWNI